MGAIIEMLKGIPLSAVLKERLTQAEAEMTALKQKVTLLEEKLVLLGAENVRLKTENAHLNAENTNLKAENAALHAKLQQVDRDKPVHGDSCPYCQEPKGKVLDIRPHPIMGEAGVKVYYYQCQGCGKKYDRQKDS